MGGGPPLVVALLLARCCKGNLTVTVIGCAQRGCAIDHVCSASLRFFPSGSEREEPAALTCRRGSHKHVVASRAFRKTDTPMALATRSAEFRHNQRWAAAPTCVGSTFPQPMW